MQHVLNLYKPVGVIPLQLIQRFKQKHPEYRDVKLGYAGRLDPMAEGVLLVLVGDENKKRKQYEDLQKTYSFDCLLGMNTDTHDALGLITNTNSNVSEEQISKQLPAVLKKIKKHTSQQYPIYSSRTVNGKSLYYWARRNLLNEITIPSHQITISELRLVKIKTLSEDEVKKYIFEHIKKVRGDFRQQEILKGWEQFFKANKTNLLIATCFIQCSSGTYVRSICEEMGKNLDVGALALRIKREQVGNFSLEDSLKTV